MHSLLVNTWRKNPFRLALLVKVSPIEYFHDHVRIEHMLFDGALTPVDGALHPDRSRPGIGLEFKHADAARFAI